MSDFKKETFTYVVLTNYGVELKDIKRANKITTITESGLEINHSDFYHKKYDIFTISSEKLKNPIYGLYIADLEANRIIARKDADYKNSSKLEDDKIIGNYRNLFVTLPAKAEVESFYLQYIDEKELEAHIEACRPVRKLK